MVLDYFFTMTNENCLCLIIDNHYLIMVHRDNLEKLKGRLQVC